MASGEWYGYARMAGPIRLCYSEATFPSSVSEAATPLRYPSTIPEGGELETFPPRPNLLFSASQNRLVEAPPAIMTPAGKGYAGTKAIIADPGEVSASFSAPASLVDGLHLPDTSPVPPLSPSKKSSLDSTTLAREKKSTMEEKMDRMDLGGVKTNSFDIDTSPPNEKCAVGSPWNASIELREE